MSLLLSRRLTDRLLVLVAFFLLPRSAVALTNRADSDLWGHLRVGRLIWETGQVPRADIFSFSAAGASWVSEEWLFQLLAYGSYAGFGSRGIILLRAALFSATLGFLAAALWRFSATARLLVFAPAVLAASLGLTCRPQLVTYAACAVLVWLAASGRERALGWASAALLPWSWLHGGFLAGAGLLLLRRPAAAGAVFLGLAATALNPYGLGLWRRLWQTLTDPAVRRWIMEWQPWWASDVGLYRGIIAGYGLALAAVYWWAPAARRPAYLWRWAGAGLAASVLSVRHLILLVLLSAVPLAAAFDEFRRPKEAASEGLLFGLCNAVLTGLGVAILALTLRAPRGIVLPDPQEIWGAYPKAAVAFLRERGLSGRLFNEYDAGNYLIWHLHPAFSVFIDPRGEHVYSAEVFKDFARVAAAQEGWREVLSRWRPDWILLYRRRPVVAELRREHGWHLAYEDPDFVLFGAGPSRQPPVRRDRPPLPWFFP